MKIWLYYIGKPRDPNSNHLAAEYIRRCTRYCQTEMREIRPDRFNLWERHPGGQKILLDSAGRQMDSARFAKLIEAAENQARDLVFLVGGHDGLPAGWASRADLLLSLSPMTWPHELARVMLAEQIYRAFAMLRGHPYPR